MDYYFNDEDIKIDNRSRKIILDLKKDKIFCPECGLLNYFEIEHYEMIGKFECDGCKKNLEAIWEKFYKDEIKTILCDSCNEHTFRYFNYCIYCGSFIGKRSEKETATRNLVDDTVALVFGRRAYFNWIKFPQGAKITIVIMVFLLFSFLSLALIFLYLLSLNYLALISFACTVVDFSLLIVISAFYVEKVKKAGVKIEDKEKKERRLLPLIALTILMDAIIGGIIYLIVYLVNKLICSECG
ncbi:MAG: hypothetical protein EAX90_12310 [Candidatus Heimdallarchaeota archaeon]|nr:hypothetical protein [Candidatus Heimdallarchaeota archaeon]